MVLVSLFTNQMAQYVNCVYCLERNAPKRFVIEAAFQVVLKMFKSVLPLSIEMNKKNNRLALLNIVIVSKKQKLTFYIG